MLHQLLALLLLLIGGQSSQGSIVGVWQADRSGLAAEWGDAYQFFADSTFVFNFDQACECGKRVLRLRGQYFLRGDTIAFRVRKRVELKGGRMVRTWGKDPYSAEWGLVNSGIHEIDQGGDQWELAAIELLPNEEHVPPRIKIDGRLYFRLSENPKEYR